MIKKLIAYFLSLYQKLKGKVQNDEIKKATLQSLPFWIASIVTGILAVFYSQLFHWVELLHEEMEFKGAWWIFILAPAGFFASWWMVNTFSKAASGGGIPQLLAGIQFAGKKGKSQYVHKLLNVKMILIKMASSVTMLLSGGAVGREGPTLQISGAVFNVVHRILPDFWPRVNHRLMLISGGAAGLAAAFNTPLGGIVFAIEELGKTHLGSMRTQLFMAVIIAGVTSQLFLGSYLFLGTPSVEPMTGMAILYVIIAALIASFLGYLFSNVILRVILWKRILKAFKAKVFWVLFTGLLFATLVYFTGNNTVGSGKPIITKLLFDENSGFEWYTFPARFAGTIITYVCGAAGGVFAPSLSIGASLGNELVSLMDLHEMKNLIIITCMIAFMTGVTHSPFTSFILVLEMTDRHTSVFPMMLAATIGFIVARTFDKKSLYAHLLDAYLKTDKPKKNTENELVTK